MFAQFFGSYLINEKLITKDQFLHILSKKNSTMLKLGAVAINKGYMNYDQVERIHEIQKIQDKKIGIIAVEEGYLTSNQVIELLNEQKSEYVVLCQILIDEGIINYNQFYEIIEKYKENYLVLDGEEQENKVEINKFLEAFYDFSEVENKDLFLRYFLLLINNLIRFIGDDFIISDVSKKVFKGYRYILYQDIKGKINIKSIFSSTENTLLSFASRFAKEEFTIIDEYVEASICDFLNIHNGLFIVNVSNKDSIELTLSPPLKEKKEQDLEAIFINIHYTFGNFDFIVNI